MRKIEITFTTTDVIQAARTCAVIFSDAQAKAWFVAEGDEFAKCALDQTADLLLETVKPFLKENAIRRDQGEIRTLFYLNTKFAKDAGNLTLIVSNHNVRQAARWWDAEISEHQADEWMKNYGRAFESYVHDIIEDSLIGAVETFLKDNHFHADKKLLSQALSENPFDTL